jgi:hypothetical protein
MALNNSRNMQEWFFVHVQVQLFGKVKAKCKSD